METLNTSALGLLYCDNVSIFLTFSQIELIELAKRCGILYFLPRLLKNLSKCHWFATTDLTSYEALSRTEVVFITYSVKIKKQKQKLKVWMIQLLSNLSNIFAIASKSNVEFNFAKTCSTSERIDASHWNGAYDFHVFAST